MPQPKRDAVHRYFIFEAESNTSMCNLCGNKMKGKHTSNLKCHLAAKHTSVYVEVANLNKNSQVTSQPTNNNKCENLIKTLKFLSMQLVTVYGRPLALLNDAPYQELLSMAASFSARSKEINEKSIKVMILEVAYKIKLKIAAEIRHKLICLKVDSATCMERRFLGVNIQYINNDKIIVRNLAVLEVFQSQTAEFLKDTLLEILDEFMIPKDHIHSITTDNGSNMKKMTKLMNGEYSSDESLLIYNDTDSLDDSENDIYNEDENHITEVSEEQAYLELSVFQRSLSSETEKDFNIRGMLCAAHTLQLVIKDAMEESVEVQSTFELARRISRILRTPTNRNLLKLANLNVPIIDCATRWASKYHMLLRLRNLKEFCESVDSVALLISTTFWDEIDSILNCLEPFYSSTLTLQKEQLTIGDFYISWMHCKSKIEYLHHPFACSLRRSLQRRETSLLETDVVLEGLYLDGRLNIVLSEEQCEKARALLKQTWKKYNHMNNRSGDTSELLDQSGPSTSRPPNTRTYANKDLSIIEQMLVRTEVARGLPTGALPSLDACLRELRGMSRIPLDTNIVQHWCSMSVAQSELAEIARTVLATPVTQVTVERMFSSLKFILSPLRSNLDSHLLQKMLLIRSNNDLLEKDF